MSHRFDCLLSNSALLMAIEEQGYHTMTPVQQQAIAPILSGKDLMAGAQTGTGKTAAFALPILEKFAQQADSAVLRALVLVPTRELAQQVYTSFENYSKHLPITSVVAYGGVSIGPQEKAIAKGVDILIATPGRLLDLIIKGSVSLAQVQVLVFDEADRMLDLGFKDEIDRILKRMPAQRQTLMFSATFDDAIFSLAKKLLNEPERIQVTPANSAAVQIEQRVYTVDKARKRELVSYLIGAKNWPQVLIFVRTKQGADVLVDEMTKDGLKTLAIHGDKTQAAREKALQAFKQGEIRALVATDVAARGIDIVDLQYVINFDLPYIAQDYVHRIGRTGRAGKQGLAITLLTPGEEYLLEEIEAVLGERLLQQWLPGFEPDLSLQFDDSRKNSRSAEKRRAKKRAFGQHKNKRR